MWIAAIVPAHNEATTIGDVVRAAVAARRVDEVIVVDGGSTDDTGAIAERAGARVLRRDAAGKGQAMSSGVLATDAPIIVFLDADLLGLRPDHVDRLVTIVADEGAGMALGLFDRGRRVNLFYLRLLPRLTGQRALYRYIFTGLPETATRGYRVEAALNSYVAQLQLPVRAVVLDGLSHRTKEEKDHSLRGTLRKLSMLSTAAWEYIAYQIRRRLG